MYIYTPPPPPFQLMEVQMFHYDGLLLEHKIVFLNQDPRLSIPNSIRLNSVAIVEN